MPKPYPVECREDVMRVARNREDGGTLKEIAKDFGSDGGRTRHVVADRHHRALGPRGQALSVRDQGCLVEPDSLATRSTAA